MNNDGTRTLKEIETEENLNEMLNEERYIEAKHEREDAIKDKWETDNNIRLKENFCVLMQEEFISYVDEIWEEEKEDYL